MNRTPDIRTRAFLPRWCAVISVAFVTPTLSAHSVVSLLANAGAIIGIGDFRQGKGKGSYGCFSVAGDDLGDWAEPSGRDHRRGPRRTAGGDVRPGMRGSGHPRPDAVARRGTPQEGWLNMAEAGNRFARSRYGGQVKDSRG